MRFELSSSFSRMSTLPMYHYHRFILGNVIENIVRLGRLDFVMCFSNKGAGAISLHVFLSYFDEF